MRQTKIVATLGPASWSYGNIEALAQSGVDIFRLNFSHGSYETHGEVIKKIKRLNQKTAKNYAILLDTKGPEIRTGDLRAPVEIKKGDRVILTIDHSLFEETGKIGVNYDAFINDVEVGELVLVDSGIINFKVLEKTEKDVICEVLDGGIITSRRHINLPGKDVSLESITEKDWADINFGIEMGVDFVALSFVRRAEDIDLLRKHLESKHAKIDIIAKIECFEATKHLSAICQTADGVMVARGDLGAEVPFSSVPRLQREIIKTAGNFGKPVIVATHMLESMIQNPIPTRAEVTDVSEAVWQRTDAIMLSGETATGKFPIKSVKTMAEIAEVTEVETAMRHIRHREVTSDREAFAFLAAKMPEDLTDVEAIVVITRSGSTAGMVSSFRPKVPIFAFTNGPAVRRRLQLCWGVHAFRIEFSSTPQITITRAQEMFLKHFPDWKGKKYVLVSDFIVNNTFIPTLQIRNF